MPQLEAIVYVSSAVGSPSEAELSELLFRARAKNVEVEVTGILLYHEGTYFQYFEGPTTGVDVVYQRIRSAPMHRGIIELMSTSISGRLFANWSMGFTRAPESIVLQLSHANWTSALANRFEAADASDGLALLLNFWQTSVHRL